MNFILLPFLLATNLVTKDEAWNNGPEYLFKIRASTISDLEQDEGRHLGTSLVVELKCRPREPDSLNCHFENAKFGRLSPTKLDPEETKPTENATYAPYNLSDNNFEMIFDRNGIQSYTVDSDETEFTVNMFRMLANQLSVGTSFRGRKGEFEEEENFTMGRCPVHYKIVHLKERNHCEGRKLKLMLIREEDEEGEEGEEEGKEKEEEEEEEVTIRIEKERAVNACQPHDSYFFGTRHTYGIVSTNASEKLTSSISRTTIAKDCFVAETINMVDIYDENERKLGKALDHLYVSLDSINPAQGSVKSISKATQVGVTVNSCGRCSSKLHVD